MGKVRATRQLVGAMGRNMLQWPPDNHNKATLAFIVNTIVWLPHSIHYFHTRRPRESLLPLLPILSAFSFSQPPLLLWPPFTLWSGQNRINGAILGTLYNILSQAELCGNYSEQRTEEHCLTLADVSRQNLYNFRSRSWLSFVTGKDNFIENSFPIECHPHLTQ